MRQLTTLLFFCLLMPHLLFSQKLPATNIYLFDMKKLSDSTYVFSQPRFLTGFNPDGYNNQPHFMNEDELYVTVQLATDTMQTDIFSLNVKNNVLSRVTQTAESEFSPTYMPTSDEDGKKSYRFSCVRVEKDGSNTQRLWSFPIDRSSKGEPVFRTIRDVGYYQWLSPRKAALFIVGSPHQLIVADTRTEDGTSAARHIGRCIRKLPNGDLVYVDKHREDTWLLMRLNTRFFRAELITATLPGSEDFAVMSDGTLLMPNGAKLYKFHPSKDNSWVEIADFSYYDFKTISRMAVTNGKIAIVVQ